MVVFCNKNVYLTVLIVVPRNGKDNIAKTRKQFLSLDEIKSLHPMQTMLYLTMLGSGFLFFTLILLYSYQVFTKGFVVTDFKLPKSFIISTFCIIGSSFFIFKSKLAFRDDTMQKLAKLTMSAFGFGIAFLIFQIIGWVELYNQGLTFSGSLPVISYLYFISGVHILHFLVGLVYLGITTVRTYKASKDPVDELLYATNPSVKSNFKQLSLYWHYLDVVWVVLFFFFLFTL